MTYYVLGSTLNLTSPGSPVYLTELGLGLSLRRTPAITEH